MPGKDLPWYIQEKEEMIKTEEREFYLREPDQHLTAGQEQPKIKVVETIVFIPATPDSKLKKELQELDNEMCKITNSPVV